jgi:hypothetical protein
MFFQQKNKTPSEANPVNQPPSEATTANQPSPSGANPVNQPSPSGANPVNQPPVEATTTNQPSLSGANPANQPTPSRANSDNQPPSSGETTTNDSVNLLPNIKITDDYIKCYINNTNYENQSDLTKFYDENYWNLIGLTPEITVQNSTQTGGGGVDDENTNDPLSSPYKYFYYILKNNPVSLLLKKRETNKSPSPSFLESVGFKKTEKEQKPYNYDSDPLHIPTALSMNPTKIKEITGSLVSPTHVFDTNPEKISNEYLDKTPQSTLIIKFTPNNGIISLTELMKTRDLNIDIDITQYKLKYKELEKIKIIKEKKKISDDIFLEEIYYINEKLVILKGILNDTSTKTVIDLSSNLSLFEYTKCGYNLNSITTWVF